MGASGAGAGMLTIGRLLSGMIGCAAFGGDPAAPAAFSPDHLEFFEKNVRPVLVEHCLACHGPDKQTAGLRVDSRAALLAGGDSGPSVIPGKPGEGYFVTAIQHGDVYQMPPKGKLPEPQIAALVRWVEMGAPWPAEKAATSGAKVEAFDFDERRKHWSFQPITQPQPPKVQNESWVRSPIDRFILAPLEQRQFRPASPADKNALLRRVTFDLTGLPPTPTEIAAFNADSSPDAFAKVVDRLLASPRYGERWARHWLDLVRYAETYGHEFDFAIPHASRYRDYVIRAFNADVPYDRFVQEHLAGDLLPDPRRLPDNGRNESIIGLTSLWLGEQTHSPVDILQAQADLIDNQIDVIGKSFVGLTIACARCHDHKFDAIRAKDYYALYGFLASSRFAQTPIDPPGIRAPQMAKLRDLKREIRESVADDWTEQVASLDRRLLANSVGATDDDPELGERLRKLLATDPASRTFLFAWKELAAGGRDRKLEDWKNSYDKLIHKGKSTGGVRDRGDRIFADFAIPSADQWTAVGDAFAEPPTSSGDFIAGDDDRAIAMILPAGWRHSGVLSRRLQGTIQSPTFTIDRPFIHVRSFGNDARIRLVIDNFQLVRSPIYGNLQQLVENEQPAWRTFKVDMWKGRRAYLEASDLENADPADPHTSYSDDGWFAIRQVLFSEHANPPPEVSSPAWLLLGEQKPTSVEELARRYRDVVVTSIAAWRRESLGDDTQGEQRAALLNELLSSGLLRASSAGVAGPNGKSLISLLEEYREAEAAIHSPHLATALVEGSNEPANIFTRGNIRVRGEYAPRRFLEAFAGPEEWKHAGSSGRLELAKSLASDRNPLFARVMVNRLWHHHFGTGIVATPDDFGKMGQPPTHPELLDYLASEFIRGGWTIKRMHRMILLSNVYQMSSQPDPKALAADPANKLIHHMPARRLDAESIRDSILAVSGRLEPMMYGPSVPLYLTPFMAGRGKPGAAGPLDGNGRRSIYQGVRRNFLSPMFLAFDFPIPFSSMGRRSVSQVPAQALVLLNNPFVLDQANTWGKKIAADATTPVDDRICGMYLSAYGRTPRPDELSAAAAFLDAQRKANSADNEWKAWANLGHAMFNVAEFIHVK